MDESFLQPRESALLGELRRFENMMAHNGPTTRRRQGLTLEGLAARFQNPTRSEETSRKVISETLRNLAALGLIETLQTTPDEIQDEGGARAVFVAVKQEKPPTR